MELQLQFWLWMTNYVNMKFRMREARRAVPHRTISSYKRDHRAPIWFAISLSGVGKAWRAVPHPIVLQIGNRATTILVETGEAWRAAPRYDHWDSGLRKTRGAVPDSATLVVDRLGPLWPHSVKRIGTKLPQVHLMGLSPRHPRPDFIEIRLWKERRAAPGATVLVKGLLKESGTTPDGPHHKDIEFYKASGLSKSSAAHTSHCYSASSTSWSDFVR